MSTAPLVALNGEWAPALRGRTAQPEKDEAVIRKIEDVPLLSACGVGDIRYIDEPLLPEFAVIGLTGDAGCGKSSLALFLAGRAIQSGRQALILDRENPLPTVCERFSRFGIPDCLQLRYWGGWLAEEAPEPACPIVADWVKACELKPLVIVDSLAAFLRADENEAQAMRAFLDQARALANFGACVVVIHHSGKADSAKDYRGSSDFKAAVDAAFHVSNYGPEGRLGLLKLRCYKSRLGFAGELIYHYQDGEFTRGRDHDTPCFSRRAVPGLTAEQPRRRRPRVRENRRQSRPQSRYRAHLAQRCCRRGRRAPQSRTPKPVAPFSALGGGQCRCDLNPISIRHGTVFSTVRMSVRRHLAD